MASSFIKPPALREGDLIGIVAPASNIKLDLLEEGCRELQRLGFRTHYRPDIVRSYRYFSGTDERRTAEFLEMLRNPEVKAIFCARGGYGSGRLIPFLEPELVRAHPKVVLGSSDITMLLNYLNKQHIVGFHGPMVATSLRQGESAYDRNVMMAILRGDAGVHFPLDASKVLRSGRGSGRLAGGCLSLIVSTLGTPYEIDTDETIFVVEDVDAKPYQIDRMLTQLLHAGKLDNVRGIVFGEMLNCVQHQNQGYALEEVILDFFTGSSFPILYGFPTGHTTHPNVLVPFGVQAELSLGPHSTFKLLEAAVSTS